MPRDGVIDYVKAYGAFCRAPDPSRQRRQEAHGFRRPVRGARPTGRPSPRRTSCSPPGLTRSPSCRGAGMLAPHIQQLHSNEYRRPSQLPEGGVLVVGTGQSGAQIAEELHACRARRPPGGLDVPQRAAPLSGPGRHLVADAIVPPRCRGRRRTSPPSRICPRPRPGSNATRTSRARTAATTSTASVRPPRACTFTAGSKRSTDGDASASRDDLGERLAFADRRFDEEFRPLFDGYIAAAGIDAPPDDRPPRTTSRPGRHGAGPRRRRHPHRHLGDRVSAGFRLGRSARVRRVGIPTARPRGDGVSRAVRGRPALAVLRAVVGVRRRRRGRRATSSITSPGDSTTANLVSDPRVVYLKAGSIGSVLARRHGRRHQERGLEAPDVRDHLAPRRGEDDADREAAPLRRGDPPGGLREGRAGRASDHQRLDGASSASAGSPSPPACCSSNTRAGA